MDPTPAFSNRQKVAILMTTLPPEVSRELLTTFSDDDVRAITGKMARLPAIADSTREAVIEEFLRRPQPEKAASSRKTVLARVQPDVLRRLLRGEHPQTLAVALSWLPVGLASSLLADWPASRQTEVARRMAELEPVSDEVAAALETVLLERLHALVEEAPAARVTPSGNVPPGRGTRGEQALLEILSHSDRVTEEHILHSLCQSRPGLVADLRERLCDFDDLDAADDGTLRAVLVRANLRDVVLATKGANRDFAERVYRLFPPEVARCLQSDVRQLRHVSWEEVEGGRRSLSTLLQQLREARSE